MTVNDLIKRLLDLNQPGLTVYLNEGLQGNDESMVDVQVFSADEYGEERVVIW